MVTNVSNIDLSWKDPYLDLTLSHRVAIGTVICLVYFIGVLTFPPVLSFERYGADPQKRGLKNQLLAQCAGGILISYMVTLPVVFWRSVIGPVFVPVYWIWNTWISCFFFFFFLVTFESLALKFVLIVVLKRMPSMMDDFVARYLAWSNVVVGSVIGMVHISTTFSHFTEMRFIGQPTFMKRDTILTFNLMLMVSVAFLMFALVVKMTVKLSSMSSLGDNAYVGENNNNNVMYNKELISMAIEIAMYALGAGAAATASSLWSSDINVNVRPVVAFLIEDLIHPISGFVICPIIAFSSNPDLRKYALSFYRFN